MHELKPDSYYEYEYENLLVLSAAKYDYMQHIDINTFTLRNLDELNAYQRYCALEKLENIRYQTAFSDELYNKYISHLKENEQKEGWYVYRFFDKNDTIIYVGKTNNICTRMNTHFGKHGHLPKECYSKVVKIEYLTFKSQNNQTLAEDYFIKKYLPQYNTKDKYHDEFTITIPQLDCMNWIIFEAKKVTPMLKGEWAEQWYLNHPVDENRHKEIRLDYCVAYARKHYEDDFIDRLYFAAKFLFGRCYDDLSMEQLNEVDHFDWLMQ